MWVVLGPEGGAALSGCGRPSPEVKHASCTRTGTSLLPSTSPQIMAVGSVNVTPPSSCGARVRVRQVEGGAPGWWQAGASSECRAMHTPRMWSRGAGGVTHRVLVASQPELAVPSGQQGLRDEARLDLLLWDGRRGGAAVICEAIPGCLQRQGAGHLAGRVRAGARRTPAVPPGAQPDTWCTRNGCARARQRMAAKALALSAQGIPGGPRRPARCRHRCRHAIDNLKRKPAAAMTMYCVSCPCVLWRWHKLTPSRSGRGAVAKRRTEKMI